MGWKLSLICCGRDDGSMVFDDWGAADAFRDSYTSGVSVDPNGYSMRLYSTGHVRAAIITATDEAPRGWRPPAARAALKEAGGG